MSLIGLLLHILIPFIILLRSMTLLVWHYNSWHLSEYFELFLSPKNWPMKLCRIQYDSISHPLLQSDIFFDLMGPYLIFYFVQFRYLLLFPALLYFCIDLYSDLSAIRYSLPPPPTTHNQIWIEMIIWCSHSIMLFISDFWQYPEIKQKSSLQPRRVVD